MARLQVQIDTRQATAAIKGLNKDIKTFANNAKSILDKVGKSFKGMASFAVKAGAAIAGAGIGVALYKLNQIRKESVELANIQDAAETKLAAVLESTGYAAGFSADQLKKMAGELQGVTTVGDETIINAQAMLATFKEIKGDVFKDATAAILDMSAVLDGDLKGAALQIGKALNDPIKGVTALTRSGVSFTDAQKDMIKSLQESGDLMGAQTIILKELQSEFGGAAAAMRKTFAGALTALSNAWGDLKEEIGYVITRNSFLIDSLNSLEGYVVKATKYINENRAQFIELAKTISINVVGSITFLIASVQALYNGFQGLRLVALGAIVALAEGFKFISQAIQIALKPLDLFLTGLAKIGVIDANPFDQIIQAADDMAKANAEAMGQVWDDTMKMNDGFEKAKGFITDFQDELKNIEAVERDPLAGAAEKMKASSKEATEAMKSNMDSYVDHVKSASEDIKSSQQTLADDIKNIQREGMTDKQVWDDVIGEIKKYESQAKEAAKSGNFEEQKKALEQITTLYKSLPKDGVKGAAPTDKQVANAKATVKHWEEIYNKQQSFSGKYTYAAQLEDARTNLKALMQDQENGGKAIISADESRRVRLEGLVNVQKVLLTLTQETASATEEAASSLGGMTSGSFIDEASLRSGVEQIKKVKEETKQTEVQFVKVGDTWTDVSGAVIDNLKKQKKQIEMVNDAIDDYVSKLKKANSTATKFNSSSSGATQKFAVGGVVSGFGGTDTVLAQVTPGEGVVTPLGMNVLGRAGLSELNVGRNPFEASPDNVTVDFAFNKKQIGTLTGERRVVNKLLTQFSDMRRSLA